MAVGKIYDTDELPRIQSYLNKQETVFIDTERQMQRKNAVISTAIFVVAGVMVVLVAKKIFKK